MKRVLLWAEGDSFDRLDPAVHSLAICCDGVSIVGVASECVSVNTGGGAG